ncbi:hypothetical protein DBR37_16310 [Herminiimonas sp. KBW02]|uniref:hypothetical protein n=1 Tax=Herminiimonas sp. KBW02 TaxID=2153363 RepID=UPI000F5A9220|nr:hypothetical protein [Herminiimonas sp. KBW02]RQO32862.1 hypothetical protein DBR37_16310 [Herminiimonas sp. KBW02]
MKRKVHAIAATLALLFIATFWTSTVAAEFLLSQPAVIQVKLGIAYALLVFIPVMVITGASGFALGGKSTQALIVAKRRRMPYIAGIGLIILVPCALFLADRAQNGLLDNSFYGIQVVELIAGAINLVLMSLNFRDGLRSRHCRQQ